MTIIYTYLWFCFGIFALMIAAGLYEDLTGGGDPKFGYNILANPIKSFYWIITLIVSCPVINLIVISWFTFALIRNKLLAK
jgi:hypothetical protein